MFRRALVFGLFVFCPIAACGDDKKGSSETSTEETTTTPDADDATTNPTNDPDVATDTGTTTPPDVVTDVPIDVPPDTADTTVPPTDVVTETQEEVSPDLSCAGRCGTFDGTKPCQCNSPCLGFGDCCEDFCDLCGADISACNGTAQDKCAGRCGAAFDPGQPCQCNDRCTEFGNCCSDYAAECATTSCEETCTNLGNQKTSCEGDTCTRTCLEGFSDCNKLPDDGCEAELARDPNNCNECDKICDSAPFAVAACRSGRCTLDCNAGRGACNDKAFDGCEIDLTTTETDCGFCGLDCPTTPNTEPVCDDSQCTNVCLGGFEDCDGRPDNGCEANLQADEATCGSCQVACAPAESCVNSGCACTGDFVYLFPPTMRYASAMNDQRFSLGLSCNLNDASIDDPTVTVTGAATGAVTGSLSSAINKNVLSWTGGRSLYAGDEVDITVGAGLRSFDSLKTSAYRVLQARVAVSDEGSGNFEAGQLLGLIGPTMVVAGDFDGDGDIDLATTSGNASGDDGTVHLNDGAGSFGTSVRALGAQAFQEIMARDMNGDGKTDVIVFNNAGTGFGATRVRWGAAQNPLSTATDIADIGSEMSPAAGDFDGDGDLDLAIGRRVGVTSNQTGSRYVNNGNGTFSSLGALSTTTTDPNIMLTLDVDSDGDLDLFLANRGVADRVLTNDGAGAFTAGTTYGVSNSVPSGIDAGDIDGDGDVDVIVANENATADKIYLGDGTGAFTEVAAPALGGGAAFSGGLLKLADIDGDADLDIIGVLSGKLAIYKNDGVGNFSGGATALTANGGFAVADLDRDGDVDIAVVEGDGVRILRNICSAQGGVVCACGNQALNGKEQCDDGPTGSASCDPDCTFARCDDGFVNSAASEQCDDGNKIDDDACRNTCAATTCSDGLKNGKETDVDCGGACATKCAPRKACNFGSDCASGICAGYVCAYYEDFEDGVLPPAFTTSGSKSWSVDQTTPISDSTYSLISGDFTVQGTSGSSFGTSSLFMSATFGTGGGKIQFAVQTNCNYSSILSFRIDGVEVASYYGRRLQLDDGYADDYAVTAGAHTFEWRYESKIGTGEGLQYPPYHRAWIDDVVLLNGAP